MCGSGSTQSLHAALGREFRHIYSFLRRRVRRACDAEDMTQEVCARGLSADATMIVSPKAFLMAIAHHVLADFYRSSSRSPQLVGLDLDMEELSAAAEDGEPDCIPTAMIDVARLLAYLPKTQRS